MHRILAPALVVYILVLGASATGGTMHPVSATHVENSSIDAAAQKHRVDPKLLRALITQESGRRRKAVSPDGARGPGQIMPATAKGLGVNIYDDKVTDDLEGSAKYLRQQLDTFDGDVDKALAAYNAGPGAVQKYGGIPPYPETQNYVKRIKSLMAQDHAAVVRAGGQTNAEKARQVKQGGVAKTINQPGMSERTMTIEPDTTTAKLQVVRQTLGNDRSGPLDMAMGIRQVEAQSAAQTRQVTLPGTPDVTISQEPADDAKTAPNRAKGDGKQRKSGVDLPGSLDDVRALDEWAGELGVPVTAKQEPGHAAGGDHDPTVEGATARDYGGTEAVRKALFRRIARALGVPDAKYKGEDLNIVKGGVRYQVISRDHGSGPHLHVGVRKV